MAQLKGKQMSEAIQRGAQLKNEGMRAAVDLQNHGKLGAIDRKYEMRMQAERAAETARRIDRMAE